MSKLSYLIFELNKWIEISERSTQAFVDSLTEDKRKSAYIRSKILPVLDKDYDNQANIVTKEAERLLKEKYEERKYQQPQA